MNKLPHTKRIILFLIIAAVIVIPAVIRYRALQRMTPDIAARAVQVIADTFYVYEPNPLHAEEAKKLNERFRYVLHNRNRLQPPEKKFLHDQCADFLEKNAETSSAFEDSVDQERFMMQESMAMATAALVSEPKEALRYFERAQESLRNNGKPDESMEDAYSALLVLQGLYLSERRMLDGTNKKNMIATISGFGSLSRKSRDSFIEIVRRL